MEEGVLITDSVITRKPFDSGGGVMYLENEKLDLGEGERAPLAFFRTCKFTNRGGERE